MALDQFLEDGEAPERSLAVLNRTEPEPFQVLLEKLFTSQDVSAVRSRLPVHRESSLRGGEGPAPLVVSAPLASG